MNAHDTATEATTVVELPAEYRDAMRRQVNRDLMVRWINVDLMRRMHNDVRKSIVLYDADGLFEYALHADFDLTDEVRQTLFDRSKVRYFTTKGI